jgi:hypothetical protein
MLLSTIETKYFRFAVLSAVLYGDFMLLTTMKHAWVFV